MVSVLNKVTTQVHSSRVHGSRFKVRELCMRQAAIKIEQFEDIVAWQLARELTRNMKSTRQPTVNFEP